MIQPLEYNVLVRPDPIEEKTKGGIILSDVSKEADKHAQTKGEIVALSPFAFTYAEWGDMEKPKVGDRVCYGRYVGSVVRYNDEDLVILKDTAISGILR